MTEQPPQRGLTRENTGYPSVYLRWFHTPGDVKAIERRASRRLTDNGIAPEERILAAHVTPFARGRSIAQSAKRTRKAGAS